MDRKIPYYKNIEKDSKKQIGRGGPRDIQRRQDTLRDDVASLRRLLEEKKLGKEVVVKDESQYLPFEEVKRKIQEAVEFTRKKEAEKYEGDLKNSNDQLSAAKKKMAILEEQLISKNAEVEKLKSKIVDSSQAEINNLEKRLEVKRNELEKRNGIIASISEDYNRNIDELKRKLDNIAEKMVRGSIFSGDSERPQIDDKVFIDPLEGEVELDSHITINAEKISAEKTDRNVMKDIEKLRDLLKAKKRDN